MTAAQKFHDRMLIAKHQTAVDTVLNRYTALSNRESFALGRLVARSEENGNWQLMDEVFMLGLYTEANALIGMIAKTATVTTPAHTAGKGYYVTNNASAVYTDFDEAADSVRNAIQDSNITVSYSTENTSLISLYRALSTANPSLLVVVSTNKQYITGQGISLSNIVTTSVLPVSIMNIIRAGVGNGVKSYTNGVEVYSDSQDGSSLNPNEIFLGVKETGTQPINGFMRSWGIGAGIGFDVVSWNTDLWQAQNELEIGQASTVDYNVQDKTYDWSNREAAADQLEELTSVIDSNSDGTTTGRTFDITGNLGITLNCQVSLDSLVAKGFAIIQ